MNLRVLLDVATSPLVTDRIGNGTPQGGSPLLWIGIAVVALVAAAVVTLVLVTRRRKGGAARNPGVGGGRP